tara:strand:+ start:890 stop:1147 length:258 start_codon:yes stop_codon:yes gene_type:complete
MALTEETVEDKIDVINKGDWSVVGVRTATVIKRDGVEISRSFHRRTIVPNADITGESTELQAVCNAAFTQARKDAYAAYLAAQEI